jgi:hypothetical protein
MSMGFIRLKILSINFMPGFAVNPEEFVIRLDLNKQVIDVSRIDEAGYLYFDCKGENITMMLADELGQAEIRIIELMKHPETLQKVTVYLAVRDRIRGWLEREAAVAVLEFFYTGLPFRGNLKLTIANADLLRDTEIIGKMDPYVVVKHQGKELKTKTLKNKGKHPDWNETIMLPIGGINETIEVKVMDQDVMKDDEVGRVMINVREAGFLSMVPILRNFELFYKQKPCGVIRLQGLFVPF